MLNFKKNIINTDFIYQNDPSISPEDAERWHLNREASKALQETHTVIERVVALNETQTGVEYLIKCQWIAEL